MGPEIATETLEHLTAWVQAQLPVLFFFLFKDSVQLPLYQRNLDRPNLQGEECLSMQITTCNLGPCGLQRAQRLVKSHTRLAGTATRVGLRVGRWVSAVWLALFLCSLCVVH